MGSPTLASSVIGALFLTHPTLSVLECNPETAYQCNCEGTGLDCFNKNIAGANLSVVAGTFGTHPIRRAVLTRTANEIATAATKYCQSRAHECVNVQLGIGPERVIYLRARGTVIDFTITRTPGTKPLGSNNTLSPELVLRAMEGLVSKRGDATFTDAVTTVFPEKQYTLTRGQVMWIMGGVYMLVVYVVAFAKAIVDRKAIIRKNEVVRFRIAAKAANGGGTIANYHSMSNTDFRKASQQKIPPDPPPVVKAISVYSIQSREMKTKSDSDNTIVKQPEGLINDASMGSLKEKVEPISPEAVAVPPVVVLRSKGFKVSPSASAPLPFADTVRYRGSPTIEVTAPVDDKTPTQECKNSGSQSDWADPDKWSEPVATQPEEEQKPVSVVPISYSGERLVAASSSEEGSSDDDDSSWGMDTEVSMLQSDNSGYQPLCDSAFSLHKLQ